jgi:hypothetical protein
MKRRRVHPVIELINNKYGSVSDYAASLGVHCTSISHALSFDDGYEKLFYKIAEEFDFEDDFNLIDRY